MTGPAAVLAQGVVQGTITDRATGKGLSGANVLLAGTLNATITEEDGTYALTDIPLGNYTLTVSFIDFNTVTTPITVTDGDTLTVDVAMRGALPLYEEIVVSGALRPEKLTEAPATMGLLTADDVQFLPSYHPSELLARLKGVDYFRAGIATHALNVRGFNSPFNARILHATDGRRASLVASGLPFGPLGTVSAEDIARQEIVLGPGGALFGPDAQNGLVHTLTKDPRTSQGTIFNVRAGSQRTFAASARHAQPLGERFAFKANVDYARAEEFAFSDSVYLDRDGLPGNEGYPEYRLDPDTEFIKGSAALYFSPSLDTDLILNYGGSNSTYLAPTSVGRTQVIDWRLHIFQARFVRPKFFGQVYYTRSSTDDTFALNQRTKNYYRALDAGATESEAEILSLINGALLMDDSRRWNAEAQVRDDLGGFEVIAGVQAQRDRADSHGTYLLDQEAGADLSINQIGGYGQLLRDLPAGLRAVFAFRVHHHEAYGFNTLPKVALLKIGERGTWRLTYSRGVAMPTILNRYGRLLGGLILGNAEGFTLEDGTAIPALRVEKSRTFEVGYRGQHLANRLRIDVNGFVNRTEDLMSPLTEISRRPSADLAGWTRVTHRGDRPVGTLQDTGGIVLSYVNLGTFTTYGADLGLAYLLKANLSATATYSFFEIGTDADNLATNDRNGDGVVDQFDHLVNAPRHKASLALDYHGERFFGTAFLRWVAAYDSFSGFQIAARTQDLVYGGVPVAADARGADAWNYGPLAGRATLDVGVGYQATPQVRVSAQATNLFDTPVREFTAAPFLGRLFSAGVRVAL